MNVYVNLSKINFEKTLGVWHFGLNLLRALVSKSGIRLIGISDAGQSIPEYVKVLFVDVQGASKIEPAQGLVELLLHHFQEPLTGCAYVVIVFDLHILDVGWKYGNPERQLLQMKKLVEGASAVITNFPRTYFDLPKVMDKVPNSWFLTISPTMRNATNVESQLVKEICAKYEVKRSHVVLLYPAQLQEHKNHITLFKAIKLLKATHPSAKLFCTGSTFKDSHAEFLREALIELKMEHDVRICGYLSDQELDALYARADVIVSSSLAEGGAYIAQEAILKNKKVAISNIRQAMMHVKIIGANVNAFDPLDIEGIAKALAFTIDNPQENSFCRAVIERWTWQSLADQYMDVLSWVANGRKPSQMPAMGPDEIGFALAGSLPRQLVIDRADKS